MQLNKADNGFRTGGVRGRQVSDLRKVFVLWGFLALILAVLTVPSFAGRPSPSSGTLEAFFNLSTVAGNHTIISAPQEGSETAGGLVGYWRFNNDSSAGEDYNGTNASLVYDYSGEDDSTNGCKG